VTGRPAQRHRQYTRYPLVSREPHQASAETYEESKLGRQQAGLEPRVDVDFTPQMAHTSLGLLFGHPPHGLLRDAELGIVRRVGGAMNSRRRLVCTLLFLFAGGVVDVAEEPYSRGVGCGEKVENLLVCALDAQTQRDDRPARVGQWFG
jgi:hypothetical protein